MFRTTFIAVTGSVGKTTTKEVLAAILATKGRTFRSIANQNNGLGVALNLLRVRPWHRFAVIEVGIGRSGTMGAMARAVRPDAALMLHIKRTHTNAFHDLEETAREKSTLLEYLVPGGLAILNGDDPRIAKMAAKVNGRVCLAGTSNTFDYWMDEISSRWPERLRFRINWSSGSCDVVTQQVGSHWAPELGMALAAAHRLGVPMMDAARAAQSCLPYPARLEPVQLPNGVTMLRDEYGGSIDTLEPSLRVLREAEARRKVLIISDFSDSGMNRRQRLKYLASAVSEWLDVLILCGRNHTHGRSAAIAGGLSPGNVHTFETLRAMAEFARRELRQGDLVLLRGRSTDHATRLYFAQLGEVQCWRENCTKTMLCDMCWELGFRPEPGVAGGLVLPKWK